MTEKYIVMYGQAMRNSTMQVVKNLAKPGDGIFHPSCLTHGIPASLVVNGQKWGPILGDWYFERSEMKQYYHLVESCPASANGLPCNADKSCGISPAPPGKCQSQMKQD